MSVEDTLGTVEEVLSTADNLGAETIIRAALLLLLGYLVIKLILHGVDCALDKSGMEPGSRVGLRLILRFVLGVILVLLVWSYLNIDMASLIAALSVIGFAVSLAIQNLLSNVAGGMQIYSTRPFTLGDYVETGGVAGTVVEMGFFYTKLLEYDNKLIQIPNSEVAAQKIINYSAKKLRRVEVKVTVSYEDSMEEVKDAISHVLWEHPKTMATPAPTARVNNYGDNGIEYVARVWCPTDVYWEVYYDVLEQIKVAFDARGITIPYPHITVHKSN